MTHTTAKCIKNAYNQYLKSNTYGLFDCYTKPSENKHRAFKYCRELVAKYNGYDGVILGFNCMVFSYGFIGKIDNRPAFFYITKDYDRYIYIDELEN